MFRRTIRESSCLHWLGCVCVSAYDTRIVLFCIGYEWPWGGAFTLIRPSWGGNHQFRWLGWIRGIDSCYLKEKTDACSTSEGRYRAAEGEWSTEIRRRNLQAVANLCEESFLPRNLDGGCFLLQLNFLRRLWINCYAAQWSAVLIAIASQLECQIKIFGLLNMSPLICVGWMIQKSQQLRKTLQSF